MNSPCTKPKTYEVIENVARFHSEIGVLYRNAFNEQVLTKLLRDKGLVFTPLFDCAPFVYLWKEHPLAAQPADSSGRPR